MYTNYFMSFQHASIRTYKYNTVSKYPYYIRVKKYNTYDVINFPNNI